jgi:hypothetical protein
VQSEHDLRLCRLMCGKSSPYRSESHGTPAARLSLAAKTLDESLRKGKAFPHIERQSRGYRHERAIHQKVQQTSELFGIDCRSRGLYSMPGHVRAIRSLE